ncbi:MAG: outer membrane protein transport protein [Chitinophagaceae bacterium]|nr:outer membrane protein transport protein [Chitinophagaceae bacterium]MCB9045042.1 outer membrane protein transport protein [Chitinophagales bacterium]
MKKHFLLIGSLLFSSMVFGAGYQLNLQGMRQLAMGGTGVAVPWDASTIFYNPAGLTSIRNVQVYGSMNALMPRTRYVSAPTGTDIQDAAAKTYTPFNVYIGGPLAYKSPVSIGLGVYTPFGTGISWDDNWTGRYMVQSISLQTVFFQPTVSYQLTDEISVGAGFVYAIGNFDYTKALPLTNANGQEANAELTGKGHGVGYNLGIHIKANENVQFGINYRSQVNMKVKRGYARFSNIPSSVSSSFINTAFESSLPMPQVLSIGMGWQINENLKLQVDANYTGWAAYDTLSFDFENNTDKLDDIHSARRYRNTVTLRAGVHYTFRNDRWAGMLGTAYDPSPVREGFLGPDLPDAKRWLATGGLSFKISERLSAIGVVEYVFSEVRTGLSTENGFKGKYHTKVINPGLAITYDFN